METPPPENPEPLLPAPAPSGPSERQWKVILHLLGLAGLLFPLGGNVAGPLIIWLVKKDTIPAVDEEGRKVLNFQISYLLYMVIAGAFIFPASCVAGPLLAVVWIAWLVLTIMGAVKAGNGQEFAFPLTIKML